MAGAAAAAGGGGGGGGAAVAVWRRYYCSVLWSGRDGATRGKINNLRPSMAGRLFMHAVFGGRGPD